ncbi:MarR family winged helix-turn-helix transcriptional regulator [Arthrobacter sp. B3I4]|uniref:MarR family winged helix-turn-helix transcriptional regulator n=1 Tax=Arthrobacter sp. B3I4 TaxID=3042267 RepID=UPI0027884905|nr:MarR family transcriptional regulator [Arthrobacter sp. B3I4]MDQ0755996.1 DNA-binding MarR family transcriptional regulator [Arthrobacter sp. B3I4]
MAEPTQHDQDLWAETVAAAPDRFLTTDLANEIEFLAARARALGSGHANALLAALDLKVRSYSVLAMACSGSEPSQRELADFLRLDPSQIVALVDALEERGLVRRVPDPRDRRSKIIRPTDAGMKLHQRAAEAVRAAEDTSLAQLDGSERNQLRVLLRKIAFN